MTADATRRDVGDTLEDLRSGGRDALDRVTTTLYHELREIAHRHGARRDAAETLATTALVHEVYLKLAGQTRAHWNDRAHFLAVAAVGMRHILADRAKARVRLKREGLQHAVTLNEDSVGVVADALALLEMDEALERLAEVDPRLARVVECRFFGGLTNEEIAEALGVTVRTVERDWAKARMLLRVELAL